MRQPLPIPPDDLSALPARIPLPMVLAMCGYGRVTLWRRIRQGKMAKPIDRGGQGFIWLRDDVLRSFAALGDGAPEADANAWDIDPVEYRAALEADKEQRRVRRGLEKLVAERAAKKAAGPKPRAPRRPAPKAVPTEPKDLGRYVSMRSRADGTFLLYFQVWPALRPKGWRATIRLPLDEPRTGNMRDRGEVARIRADAKTLYQSMTRERLAQLGHATAAQKAEKPDA